MMNCTSPRTVRSMSLRSRRKPTMVRATGSFHTAVSLDNPGCAGEFNRDSSFGSDSRRISSYFGSLDRRTLRSGGDVGSQWPLIDREHLHNELKAQNFDKIRFTTYRTACKLRFIQKKVYFHLVDIYNVIEAFRENNLHGDALNGDSEVSVGKLEATLSTVYYYLNKRLPSTHQLNVEQALSMLMGWILGAYDPDFTGSVKVISIKVALSTLCSGKYVDKLKYVFENLVSDAGGSSSDGSCLNTTKFDSYLKQVLALPTSVHEGPSFGYEPNNSLKSCFPHFSQPGGAKVKINDYLDTMFADPGPQCLLWLPLMHRMANVENVLHPIACSFCNAESMMGFRYKCQRCPNYQLCQTCFWYGQASGNHSNDHEMKEYSTYKSPAKQFTHTLRKGTMKCLPTTTNRVKGGPGGTGGPGGVGGGVDPNSPDGKMSYGIDSVDGPSVNLQHIMCWSHAFPAQPVTDYGLGTGVVGVVPGGAVGLLGAGVGGAASTAAGLAHSSTLVGPGAGGGNNHPNTNSIISTHSMLPPGIRDPALIANYESRLSEALENSVGGKMDDEHRLIARYAAKLAQETLNSLSGRPVNGGGPNSGIPNSGGGGGGVSGGNQNNNFDINRNQKQREILADLHQKNRDIMREIARLKEERDETSRMSSLAAAAAGGMHPAMVSATGQFMPGGARAGPGGVNNPSLVHELRSLRQRKEELEQRMACLQESRRELMVQLESLMKMLRTSQPVTAAPSSNQSQNLGNFSSNSTTTGSSPNYGGGHNSHQKLSQFSSTNTTTGAAGGTQTLPHQMNNGTLPSSTTTTATDPNAYPPPPQTLPRSGQQQAQSGGGGGGGSGMSPAQQQNQQLHQELLISAENASHAAIDLLSKLSLRMAPDMDPGAINAFAYYPYSQQTTDPSVGALASGASGFPAVNGGSAPTTAPPLPPPPTQLMGNPNAAPNAVLPQPQNVPNLCT
ncbi:dystrobrevin beta-like isoform X4 [Convolutriloba macropyga]|uniref:dystrobrevin beta-like isoform X4 n=1 Tax=Convolutriloba macropyga TaxID=536237 RepID=UPI003F51CBB8